MSASTMLVAVAVAWVAIGVGLAIVMGRRGYSAWGWLVIGALLGPLAVVLAIFHDRPAFALPDGIKPTLHSVDKIDVLVGVDGSPEAFAAVLGVGELFGPRLGRLTAATVIPFDAPPLAHDDAAALLGRAQFLDPDRADRVLLHGVPASALREHAVAGGYDAIAVGTTGRGLAKTLLGSVATALAHRTKVPVILYGSDR